MAFWLSGGDYAEGLFGLLVLGLAVAVATFFFTSGNAPKNVPAGSSRVPYAPSTLPLVRNTLDLVRNTHRFHDWLADRSLARGGKPFVLCLPGDSDFLFISRPEDFEQILTVQSDNFSKGGNIREVYADFMGDNIVLINGDRWKYHRRVLVSLFSARALREHMVPIIQRHTLELQELVAQASATHEVLDVYKLAKRFTLETFVEIGFGRKLGLLASGLDHPFEVAFDEAHHIAAARFNSPAWLWKLKRSLNIGSERHLREDMVVINQFVMEIIASAMERRQLQGENPAHDGDLEQPLNKDIVSIVLDTMEVSGHAVTPTEVRDIALAGLIAGRDTTGDSLSWLLHMLHQNPRVEGKLRAEILATIPKMTESESYMPSMEEVQSLQYLEATVREVLRLFPPVPIIPYNCIRETVFPDGTFIPVGTDISLLTYASGRIPSVWGPDAADFLPERFLDGKTGNLLQMPPTKFAAFSAGPRVCVGRNLAMLEMKIVITCLVSRFHLVQVPGQDVGYIRGVTLGMKNPLLMQVESIAVGPEVVASTPATHA